MNAPDPLLVRRSTYWWQCPDCDAEGPARSSAVAEATYFVHWHWTHGEGKK